ncbi:gluconate 5-dehydrogenase [Capronia epimyces CBS 606.96]|uniref:Gluconate 5-dehydrogenase n=1 Tax=Capronia epimyces CBS 606.96 TaxID=1182542 RepID=W9YJB8_9EURO|nr:gluconate 5-dehydrogenase [Capronia epimyces CBS 606.96]EXJ92992.1 gluconate 5-dehydrogenase [Capronia epimyces CBS 606.96]
MGDADAIPAAPKASASASASPDDRASLTTRNIPTMGLSSAENPLTAPLPPVSSTSPAERAAARFRVEGCAVLTGGAGTLALASARALLEHGVEALTLMDLHSTIEGSTAEIARLRTEFPPATVHTVPVDVTSESEVDEAFKAARDLMGRIDLLCCFAGIVGCVHSLAAQADQFRRVVDVNLVGSFLCAQAAAKYMVDAKTGGSILFTASISAHATNYPQPQAAYNVSKAGVAHLTRNLAAEWAVHGIRVNCISPGYMDTVLNAGDNLKPVRDIWASRCPMGRMGHIEEITGPVVLLSSKRGGRYITGADLLVDGGALCF